jgi:poly(ribitol-phosphate) beta-N-acetylglucosaminyltransferase
VPSPGVTPDDTDVTDEIAAPFADVVFRNRETLVEYLGALDATWSPPDALDDGSPATFVVSGAIDLATVAAGQPLGAGTWDAFLRVGLGGWESLRRLPCPPALLRVHRVAPIPGTGLRAQPYVTGPGNLSIRVASANAVSTARAKAGLVRLAHRLPPPVRGALRRAARAVRVR